MRPSSTFFPSHHGAIEPFNARRMADLSPIARQRYSCADDLYIEVGRAVAPPKPMPTFKAVYHALLDSADDRNLARKTAEELLRRSLERVARQSDDLPDSPDGLAHWMEASAEKATAAYRDYLASRKNGAPRRYFSNRSHALYFLQAVAPTKLVDGSWLYGTLRHCNDPRMSGLAQTYFEELGNGDETKNHVLLYRQLLEANALTDGNHLPDPYFEQGAIQLALGLSTEAMLPEVIGFNLGYEQLPLHLLITAYELNELGLDPYYFTLHVTVDNTDSGHARKAIDAVTLNASRYKDPAEYWRRVRAGYRLNELGLGTTAVIEGFDNDAEILRIFAAKSAAGAGAHSDYCRIDGRTVNEWLGGGEPISGFLRALENKGWIVRNAAPEESRFWHLLQGDRAEMFGVFTDYELQVICDWLRGTGSLDGLKFDVAPEDRTARPRSFRASAGVARRAGAHESRPAQPPSVRRSAAASHEDIGMTTEALSPGRHWTPEGLQATQQLVQRRLQ